MRKFVTISFLIFIYIANFQLFAQSGQEVIQFDKTVHNFGDILLSDGAVTCTFNFTNISSKPIVIHNVISSCGCTTPEWTKSPVQPKGAGIIKVVFSNDQGPYPFDKSLTVYVSGLDRPVVLKIKGIVHESKKDVSEMFSVRIGQLGIRKKNLTIGYINQGEVKSDNIDIANLTTSDMRVESYETSQGVLINITPNPIPAKSVARLTYIVNSADMGSRKWGKQSFSTKLSINGKKYSDIISIDGVIKDNFKDLTKAQINNAPIPAIDRSYFEFGEVKEGKVVEATFVIKNKGKSELIIHKVENELKGVTYTTKVPLTIKAGAKGELKLKFNTSGCNGEVINILTLVTNSPAKPMMNLFLTGNVIN
ncbi:MAG: DUF1573 domain-containing protein [Bacteroidales bacterium]|nr:DUF1573 domain-containing protein [Bacteroidales bacterium]MDD4670404.1 DUF1573 domain-containing protein [Bacteroidales bacterium]